MLFHRCELEDVGHSGGQMTGVWGWTGRRGCWGRGRGILCLTDPSPWATAVPLFPFAPSCPAGGQRLGGQGEACSHFISASSFLPLLSHSFSHSLFLSAFTLSVFSLSLARSSSFPFLPLSLSLTLSFLPFLLSFARQCPSRAPALP